MADIDSIELLRRQYLQLLDPDELALPNPELLRLPSTQSRMYDRMFNEAKKVYPPPERYKFRVLKRLVGALEQAIEDPEEDVGPPLPTSPISDASIDSLSPLLISSFHLWRRIFQMIFPNA